MCMLSNLIHVLSNLIHVLSNSMCIEQSVKLCNPVCVC